MLLMQDTGGAGAVVQKGKGQLKKQFVEFISDFKALFSATEPMTHGSECQDVSARLTLLASLQSELTYRLSDCSAVAKRLSERAFLHLQRSIVADPSIGERWQKAFTKTQAYERREERCEKLGGAHLLLHGIWAFKVNASGGRTDLAFGEPIINLRTVERTAEALVLTEWKCVDKESDLQTKAKEAREQAELYKAGILGGLELAQYRYVVLVSAHNLPELDDWQEKNTVYRHINIAVNPESPSRVSQQRSRPRT